MVHHIAELALEGAEQHAVAGVVREERFGFLDPGTVDGAGLGVAHGLEVALLAPGAPEHAQLARLRAEHLRAVGHPTGHLQAEGGLAQAVHLAAACKMLLLDGLSNS